MADRPILFSGPMVRAILDGRKTQTRRVLKLGNRLPDYIGPRGCTNDPSCWGWSDDDRGDHWLVKRGESDKGCLDWSDWAGAYQVGHRLWVRETWRPHYLGDGVWNLDVSYAADGERRTIMDGEFGEKDWSWPKAADRGNVSSLFMPRWASRLTLTVTDVRVQRLRDISEDDAVAEGCPCQTDEELAGMEARGWFCDLWDSLNAKRGFGWDANPWVCAVSFEVQKINIDQLVAA